MDEKAPSTTVIEVQEQSAKAGGTCSTQYDASKISLVAELKRKDSFGKPLSTIPCSITGRYKPIADDDKSLRPIATNDEENPSTEDINPENLPEGTNSESKDHEASSSTKEDSLPPLVLPESGMADPKDNTEADAKKTADGGVKRDSLVATVTVITSLMKWQMKSKTKAGIKLKSLEKYKGHLEVIQRRSRQEQVDLPFPIRLSISREILPIVHNIVKEYRLALGHDHKLTLEAMSKEQQLRSQLAGEGIFL